MELDWRGRVIVEKFTEGCTLREAARAAGITRQAVLHRYKVWPGFRAACEEARMAGAVIDPRHPLAVFRQKFFHANREDGRARILPDACEDAAFVRTLRRV